VPTPHQIWDDIREELRSETPDFKFEIWIEPLELAGISGNTLFVRAPEHIRTSVSERYLPLLRRAAARRFHPRAVVQVVGAHWSAPPEPRQDRAAPAATEPPAGGRLNPKYTFEQFVIGEGNRFAHAAALAVAELPAQAYNPLFLPGPPGIGKPHLAPDDPHQPPRKAVAEHPVHQLKTCIIGVVAHPSDMPQQDETLVYVPLVDEIHRRFEIIIDRREFQPGAEVLPRPHYDSFEWIPLIIRVDLHQ
jgi:hypothetical protein